MPSNSKYRTRELEKCIKLYIHEGVSYKKLCKEYGLLMEASNFNKKILSYQEDDLIGIQSSRTDNHYSKDFKYSVVMEHLEEGATMKELARKYNIPAHTTVRDWIEKYTKGKDFRVYSEKTKIFYLLQMWRGYFFPKRLMMLASFISISSVVDEKRPIFDERWWVHVTFEAHIVLGYMNDKQQINLDDLIVFVA